MKPRTRKQSAPKSEDPKEIKAIDLLLSEVRLRWLKAAPADKRVFMNKIDELLDERVMLMKMYPKGAKS